MLESLRKCAACGMQAEERCARCGRPLCKEDYHPPEQRCRFCEREYWRQAYSGRMLALTILVTSAPIAAGLVLLTRGLFADGFLLLALGPVAAMVLRIFVVGKRSGRRKQFLGEQKGRLPGAAANEE